MVSWICFLILCVVYWASQRKHPKWLLPQGKKIGQTEGDVRSRVYHGARFAVLFTALSVLVMAPLTWFGSTSVGASLGSITTGIFGSRFGLLAAGLLVAALVFAIWGVFCDFELDLPERICLMAMPFLAAVAIGPAAAGVSSATQGLQGMVTATIGPLFI